MFVWLSYTFIPFAFETSLSYPLGGVLLSSKNPSLSFSLQSHPFTFNISVLKCKQIWQIIILAFQHLFSFDGFVLLLLRLWNGKDLPWWVLSSLYYLRVLFWIGPSVDFSPFYEIRAWRDDFAWMVPSGFLSPLLVGAQDPLENSHWPTLVMMMRCRRNSYLFGIYSGKMMRLFIH